MAHGPAPPERDELRKKLDDLREVEQELARAERLARTLDSAGETALFAELQRAHERVRTILGEIDAVLGLGGEASERSTPC